MHNVTDKTKNFFFVNNKATQIVVTKLEQTIEQTITKPPLTMRVGQEAQTKSYLLFQQ